MKFLLVIMFILCSLPILGYTFFDHIDINKFYNNYLKNDIPDTIKYDFHKHYFHTENIVLEHKNKDLKLLINSKVIILDTNVHYINLHFINKNFLYLFYEKIHNSKYYITLDMKDFSFEIKSVYRHFHIFGYNDDGVIFQELKNRNIFYSLSDTSLQVIDNPVLPKLKSQFKIKKLIESQVDNAVFCYNDFMLFNNSIDTANDTRQFTGNRLDTHFHHVKNYSWNCYGIPGYSFYFPIKNDKDLPFTYILNDSCLINLNSIQLSKYEIKLINNKIYLLNVYYIANLANYRIYEFSNNNISLLFDSFLYKNEIGNLLDEYYVPIVDFTIYKNLLLIDNGSTKESEYSSKSIYNSLPNCLIYNLETKELIKPPFILDVTKYNINFMKQ